MYEFIFARTTPGPRAALLQRVTVTAPTSAYAWALFEALYPQRHFVAFTCTHV
jgi:hypothetical protein